MDLQYSIMSPDGMAVITAIPLSSQFHATSSRRYFANFPDVDARDAFQGAPNTSLNLSQSMKHRQLEIITQRISLGLLKNFSIKFQRISIIQKTKKAFEK